MKLKNDFVTNSSTTSFVGWGIHVESDEILKNEKILKLAYDEYGKEASKNLSFEEWKEDFSQVLLAIVETGYELFKEDLDFSCGSDYYSETLMIAGSPNKMKDSQTLGEYKEEIKKKLNDLGFEVTKLEYIEEAWRDG
jgi:hypothetical protein